VAPYATPTEAAILHRNTDRQAAIVNLVREARASYGGSLTAAMRDLAGWRRLVRKVERILREMPLWRLQRIGAEQLNFLYENRGDGGVVHLLPGIAYCFRRFHALISDLVQGAWVRYVRQQNLTVIGETADLHEFLFGSERNSPAIVRPVLLDLQLGRCFYCNRGIVGDTAQVDHFVAWARYPVDLAHNFVLADSKCNSKKRDRLPACEHLAAWTERNAKYGAQLGDALGPHGIVGELATSNRVAQWAYAQTEAACGLTWLRADEMVQLTAGWRDLIRS
jgi:5-methylcytosine-specific restriction endonuclease McrA